MSEEERKDLEAILTGDYDRIDARAEKLAAEIRSLNRTQLRNFYGPLVKVRVELDAERQRNALRMLRPRLAYMVARDRNAEGLWKWFAELLKRASRPNQIGSVCDFAEAVIAYHRRESR